jgi:choline-sulfatase
VYNLGTPGAKYMIRDGRYKYTHWVNDMAELYDLERDPQELRNLAKAPEHQAIATQLKQKLFQWHTPKESRS